jgi:Ca-activated chloride channel family protein
MILSQKAEPGMSSRYARARTLLSTLFLVSLLLIFPANLFGQDDSDIEVVRVRTDLVTVPAYVTDEKGRRVKNLAATDFELRDDGSIARIEYFATGTEHVALIFALDASGSTREIIKQQRETALALFSRFGRGSEVAVIRFMEQAELAAPFSDKQENALPAFDLPAVRNRRTAIFDAALNAVRAFDTRPQNSIERRIIILISDGLDTVSSVRPRAVIEEAQRRGVSLYAIHLPLYTVSDGRLRPRAATKGFRDLAEQTGGRYFLAGDARSALNPESAIDLSQILQAIEEDLQGQYVFGYYPQEAAHDGRFHRIDLRLTAKDKRKLRVRLLREGYTLKKS